MADLGDLGEFLDNSLDFDLDGRHYSVPPVEWPVYLELLAAQEHAIAVEQGRAKPEDGPEDRPIYQLAPTVLGPVHEQLVEARQSGPRISLIARAAYLFQVGEIEIAKVLLQSLGKARSQSHPEPTSPTPTGSTGTAAASTTRRRASSSGTRSRPKSPKKSEHTEPAAT